MRRDSQLVFATAVSIAASAAGSTVLTDVVYIPQVNDHKGTAMNDRPNVSGSLFWNCIVDGENMLAAVDGSVVTFELYADSDSTPTTGGTVILTKAITENTPTDHPDGTQLFCIPLPIGQFGPYLGVKVSVATQDLSTGKVSCWIGPPLQQG